MEPGEIAALVAAGAFLMLVILLAVPIVRLTRTIDAATRAINEVNAQTTPLLDNANIAIEKINTALDQVQTSLDGVNHQLAKLDTMTGHVQAVTANVANLTTVISAAAANPLIKLAAFGYGLRRATAARRRAEEEREVREALKQRRAQRGRR
ncbi:MAG TPA: DUF948 domain-containing protein [Micromonospora sp.]